ncbi:hypothetical protein [Methanolobus sp.]|nr:hypothetical protein [Methanolobus sp.]
MKFKPMSKHCPECKKFLFITSADQKEVECTNCKSKFWVLRNGEKLEKI